MDISVVGSEFVETVSYLIGHFIGSLFLKISNWAHMAVVVIVYYLLTLFHYIFV